MSKFLKKLKIAMSSKMLVLSIVPLAMLYLFFTIISSALYGTGNLIDTIIFLANYVFLCALSVKLSLMGA